MKQSLRWQVIRFSKYKLIRCRMQALECALSNPRSRGSPLHPQIQEARVWDFELCKTLFHNNSRGITISGKFLFSF